MANIHTEARSGTLTNDSLKAFLKADPSVIDLPGGPKGLTPLASACYAGHLNVVKLLLDNHANVDTPSSKNRTPLLHATFHPKRLAIVRLLLDFGADPNITDDDETTPLINAVLQSRDHDMIHELVDRGADQSLTKKGQTVEVIAKNVGLEKELKPKSERSSSHGTFIDLEAAKLRDDPTTDLGKPGNVKRLTRLSLYQPIIYCDDSGSMAGENRFASQRQLVTRIARIATKIIPDDMGVYLQFINAKSTFGKSVNQIEAEYDAHRPSGGTPIGISLRQKILQPLVYDVIAKGGRLEHPLLICAITAGCPEDGDTFKDEIVKCKQKLLETGYEATTVQFCISQIGSDSAAIRFLDGLRSDRSIQDVLFCTTDHLDDAFHQLRENEEKLEVWLLDTLTRPIMSGYSD